MNKKIALSALVVMMLTAFINISAQEVHFQGKTVVMNDTVANLNYPTSVGELAVVHDINGNYALLLGISTNDAELANGDYSVTSNVVTMPAKSVLEGPVEGNDGVSYGTGVGMTDGEIKIMVTPVNISQKPSYIMLLQSKMQPQADVSITLIPWNLDLYTGLIGMMMGVLQH